MMLMVCTKDEFQEPFSLVTKQFVPSIDSEYWIGEYEGSSRRSESGALYQEVSISSVDSVLISPVRSPTVLHLAEPATAKNNPRLITPYLEVHVHVCLLDSVPKNAISTR